MTSCPIEDAYLALSERLADHLVAAGFVPTADRLLIDPEARWEPEGAETEVQTAAALFQLRTAPVRQLMGAGPDRPRWVVERDARLELSATGAVPEGDPTHGQRILTVLALVAGLPASDPTLGQQCERLELTVAEDNDVPTIGRASGITFTLRVRSSDPLGLTAP